MPPKPVNTADEGSVGEQKNKAKRDRELELADMAFFCGDPRGRRFLWRYIEFCGWRKSSFTGNNSETFFLEGQRNIAMKMIADITQSSPEAFFTMLKEAEGDPDA
jgi:hypothetical protein